MTNKQWLFTLDNYSLALFCLDYMPLIGKDSLSSAYAIKEWLNFEYKPEYHITKMFNQMLKLHKRED